MTRGIERKVAARRPLVQIACRNQARRTFRPCRKSLVAWAYRLAPMGGTTQRKLNVRAGCHRVFAGMPLALRLTAPASGACLLILPKKPTAQLKARSANVVRCTPK